MQICMRGNPAMDENDVMSRGCICGQKAYHNRCCMLHSVCYPSLSSKLWGGDDAPQRTLRQDLVTRLKRRLEDL